MKQMRHFPVFYLTAIALVFGLVGCFATADDVKKAIDDNNAAIAAVVANNNAEISGIVAKNNAALIDQPEMPQPGTKITNAQAWRKPVEQMDRIIAQNPDQTTLVNHLRFQQAWILTVYRQDNLAEARWKLIDSTALTTERDRSLFANWQALVWWYKRAPDPNFLSIAEVSKARDHITTLDETIKNVESHELKVLLATIRALIAFRIADSNDAETEEEFQPVREAIVADLETFVSIFTEEEQRWVQNNSNTDVADYLSIYELRNRIWLRDTIKEFLRTARKFHDQQGFTLPTWKPTWINNLKFSEPE